MGAVVMLLICMCITAVPVAALNNKRAAIRREREEDQDWLERLQPYFEELKTEESTWQGN